MAVTEELLVDPRFCGPPDVAHGGYIAGLLAARIKGAVEVAIRRRVPLRTPLVLRDDGEAVLLLEDETLLATAKPAEFTLACPEAVSITEAARASATSPLLRVHHFPGCFACGTARTPDDGLRVFPGPVGGAELFAAPWTPPVDEDFVPVEFLAAVLDCTGGVAAINSEPSLADTPWVTGKIALRHQTGLRPGEDWVVVGWRERVEGRKLLAGSALFSSGGTLSAVARTTWYRLNE